MAESSRATSSQRLAHDLSALREEQGISLESLHEATKIPIELLREFEKTGLHSHPMFNRVYLRSLIRAYAETIGFSTETALSALDKALDGSYDGTLRKQEATAFEPESKEIIAATSKDVEAETVADASAVSQEAKETPPPDQPKPTKQPEKKPMRESRPAPETLSAANWETQSGKASSRTSKPIDLGRQTQWLQWGLIGLVVLVLVGAVWGVLALIGGNGGDPVVAQEATTTDTTAVVDTTTAQPVQQQPVVVVGDTINVVVLAELGKVQGIRIKQDDDLRRPYWIEQGNSKAFPVLNRIVIEQDLENIKLLVEGYPYPTNRRDEQGRIVITRESVQAFADSLSGSPANVDSTIVDRIPVPSE